MAQSSATMRGTVDIALHSSLPCAEWFYLHILAARLARDTPWHARDARVVFPDGAPVPVVVVIVACVAHGLAVIWTVAFRSPRGAIAFTARCEAACTGVTLDVLGVFRTGTVDTTWRAVGTCSGADVDVLLSTRVGIT